MASATRGASPSNSVQRTRSAGPAHPDLAGTARSVFMRTRANRSGTRGLTRRRGRDDVAAAGTPIDDDGGAMISKQLFAPAAPEPLMPTGKKRLRLRRLQRDRCHDVCGGRGRLLKVSKCGLLSGSPEPPTAHRQRRGGRSSARNSEEGPSFRHSPSPSAESTRRRPRERAGCSGGSSWRARPRLV